MTLPQLGAELPHGIDRRVDVAPQAFLSPGQASRDLRERHVPHDEQVNVAISAELSTSGRSEEEGDDDPISDRHQRLTNHVDSSGGLHE